jgi:type IX secretion system PorP/SprF family membrane protein
MYTSSWYIGASVQQLIPQTLNFGTTSSQIPGKIVPHFFFTTGVKVFLSDDVTAMPSVMVKVTNPVPPSFDLNMKLTFKDIFWLGAAYRRNDSYALLTGINISSVINVGYSYDITTSNLNTVSNGTHEIVIGVLLNNRYKATCPRYSF